MKIYIIITYLFFIAASKTVVELNEIITELFSMTLKELNFSSITKFVISFNLIFSLRAKLLI